MDFIKRNIATLTLLFICLPLSMSAKVSSDKAQELGRTLTPTGALIKGNADGSIPAWDWGLDKPMPGYQEGGHHPDPFADEQAIFTVTSSNVAQYSDMLSQGQQAIFKRYPDSWKMKVYPSHRTAAYPEHVYRALKHNVIAAELVDSGNGVRNAMTTSPFPIPNNGLEVIWNHLMRYRGESLKRTIVQVAPTSSGSYIEVVLAETALFPYAKEGMKVEDVNNKLAFLMQELQAPPFLAGNILLVHDPIDQQKEPRSAWTYNAGQRRVRRAPNIAFDTPGTGADGQRTTDQFDMFSGSPERYEWKLIGKKEMIVPYNAYPVHSNRLKHKEIVNKGHMNPDHLRYEKHRVWEVEATVKSGTSHIYAKRVLYFDEDSWQILVADQYDSRNQIWRVSEAHCISYYEIPLFFDTLIAHYDLLNGRYLVIGLNNEGSPEAFNLPLKEGDYKPEALRRKGRR